MPRTRALFASALAVIGLGITSASAQRPQERQGFWFGFGLGYGNIGCDDCDNRSGSGSGYIKLGGTVSRKVLLGFESNGWAKTEDDATVSLVNGSAVVYFYPSATGGFHLKGGLGIAVVEFSLDLGGPTLSVDDTGVGGLLGLGYDFRIGRNVSLVPFLNFLGATFRNEGEKTTFNFYQLGLGLTIH